MKYLLTVLLLFVSSYSLAAVKMFDAKWTEVTEREGGTAVVGEVTYDLYGGNLGGPFSKLLSTSDLSAAGEIDLDDGAGEFYMIVCEDGRCGKQSDHKIAECETSVIGTTTLGINLNCN